MKNPSIALVAGLAIIQAATAAPRLIVSTPSLVPESQIDLVLDSSAVAISELGKTVENSWMQIAPPLPGKILWKAQNIAQLIPDGPPVIGTTYTFSIAGKHNLLDGSELPSGEFATAASESFRVVATHAPNRGSSNYSPSTGAWMIVFNDAVDPAAAANFISFGSSSEQRVAAHVEQPTYEQAGYYGRGYKPWADRFAGAKLEEPEPDKKVNFMLLVTPASPLPPGKDWKASIFKELPNASASSRTTALGSCNIGEIKPFGITSINARISADEPRHVVIGFNYPVTESMPVDFLTKCIEITPRPDNLSARLDGREIILTGNLTAEDQYTVTMRPPFTSEAGLDLSAPLTREIKFEHLDPELILPSNNEAQLATGSRTYRIQTVNLTSVHVRIKKLSGENLVRAYQGYRQYTGSGHNGRSIDPTSPLPYSLITGETIYDKEIPLGNPVDSSKEITLRWDEMLPADLRNAAFFLDITGSPTSASPGNSPARRRSSTPSPARPARPFPESGSICSVKMHRH
jgi:hypothetical protein